MLIGQVISVGDAASFCGVSFCLNLEEFLSDADECYFVHPLLDREVTWNNTCVVMVI